MENFSYLQVAAEVLENEVERRLSYLYDLEEIPEVPERKEIEKIVLMGCEARRQLAQVLKFLPTVAVEAIMIPLNGYMNMLSLAGYCAVHYRDIPHLPKTVQRNLCLAQICWDSRNQLRAWQKKSYATSINICAIQEQYFQEVRYQIVLAETLERPM